jgi:hypothetical protein
MGKCSKKISKAFVINRYIGRLWSTFREVQECRLLFEEIMRNSPQPLCEGDWRLEWWDKPYIYCMASPACKALRNKYRKATKDYPKKEKLLFGFRNFLCGSWKGKIKNQPNADAIDLVMLERNGGKKYLNLENRILISDGTTYAQYMELKKYGFWFYFSSPRLEERPQMESIIDYIQPSMLTNDQITAIFVELLECYQKYLFHSKAAYRDDIRNETAWYRNNDPDLCDELGELATNFYYQHGDLSRNNILVDQENKLWLIDLEYAGFYPFYYDIFMFILSEYGRNGSLHLWNEINRLDSRANQIFSEILKEQQIGNELHTRKLLFISVILQKGKFDIHNNTEIWSRESPKVEQIQKNILDIITIIKEWEYEK